MTDNQLVQFLLEQLTAMRQENDEMRQINQDLRHTIQTMTITIASLQQTIQDLQDKLGNNSRNSSRPPSSDGYSKPDPKSSRKPSGKKRGAQKGHPGTSLYSMTKDLPVDRVVQHCPGSCMQCSHFSECIQKAVVQETRRVLDIEVRRDVIDHQTMLMPACPYSTESLCGEFPPQITACCQYGDKLKTLAVSLNVVASVPLRTIAEIIRGIAALPITEGAILSFVKQAADRVSETVDRIWERLIDEKYVHFDETGMRVNGKLNWTHVSCTDSLTYYEGHAKRGYAAMEDIGVLPLFSGTAIHDCWAPYWKSSSDVEHALCCAHLLRELQWVNDHGNNQTWANPFKDLLLKMKQAVEAANSQGLRSLPGDELQAFELEYDQLLELGYGENPVQVISGKRGRPKRGKIRCLLDRLKKYKASVCLFARDFNVTFTNNQAERDLRTFKTKIKVTGGFRAQDSMAAYLVLKSYLSTGIKHGHPAFQSMLEAFNGNPESIFQ